MDDLQFRRSVYADPHCSDNQVIQAASNDPAKREFWNELRRLETTLEHATRVDVPNGLAERLILRQSIESHRAQTRRFRWQLGIAAGIAFVFGVSFTLWQQQSFVNLGEHALAHIYHEADGFALKVDGDIDLTTVNAKLASVGTQFTDQVSRIYFAGFCNFEGVRSIHMVMQGENGKVTVFVVPPNDNHRAIDHFSDGKLKGQTLELERARLIMVGEEGKPFDGLRKRLEKSVIFSA